MIIIKLRQFAIIQKSKAIIFSQFLLGATLLMLLATCKLVSLQCYCKILEKKHFMAKEAPH